MGEEQYTVTPIEEIKKQAGGRVVSLPGWEEDKPFYARLKRPSLLSLISAGKIPNSLIGVAGDIFEGKKNSAKDDNLDFAEVGEVLDIMIEASLVEPAYAKIKEYLTDEQKLAIFNYTQQGVRALEPFREIKRDSKIDSGGNKVEEIAK